MGSVPGCGSWERQLIDVFSPIDVSLSLSPSLPLSLKINKLFFKQKNVALAGVAQWIERRPRTKGSLV